MHRMFRLLTIIPLSLVSTISLASPFFLITHNTTDSESNAYISSTIPSPHPSKPHSDNKVSWISVRMACFGHVVDGKCPALIKMDTNTGNPLEIGMVSLDLATGDITPKQISANGYTMTVNGPGESTLTKD